MLRFVFNYINNGIGTIYITLHTVTILPLIYHCYSNLPFRTASPQNEINVNKMAASTLGIFYVPEQRFV